MIVREPVLVRAFRDLFGAMPGGLQLVFMQRIHMDACLVCGPQGCV